MKDNKQTPEEMLRELQGMIAGLTEIESKRGAQEAEQLLTRNRDFVEKFLEIAERKVSTLDDYGDEQWDKLPDEIRRCLTKISERDGKEISWELPEKWKGKLSTKEAVFSLPSHYMHAFWELEHRFTERHAKIRSEGSAPVDFQEMSGSEFEVYVGRLLRSAGYDVRGTRTSGDQGADLIAKKDGRTIIIQAKRYHDAVGNKAVQEVISAVSFYGGDEGWVVTNSTFTPSAIALAQRANIKLFDGAFLRTKSFYSESK